ncbi:hypothetical protein [Leptospira perolatii]|nr:hypothetical protein [Leptospira perolatii]
MDRIQRSNTDFRRGSQVAHAQHGTHGNVGKKGEAPKAKPFKVHKLKQKSDRPGAFWLWYLILSIASFLPLFGFVASFLLYSMAKNRFFKILPLIFSIGANGYLLYLRFYAEAEFHNLQNLVK